jgi:hypothetical protein
MDRERLESHLTIVAILHIAINRRLGSLPSSGSPSARFSASYPFLACLAA